MKLSTGSMLGPYEVVEEIGGGGMGIVYRARDPRLERDVAVKLLTSQLSERGGFKERFAREAKTIAKLQHPHVCSVFDVGESDDHAYLVMELLEGETLAERIRRGPLPLAELQRIGSEIAEGLDAAHRAGLVHRDLKPSNVMLTPSGAKLLDFGLARTMDPQETSPANDAATLTAPLTTAGHIVGTRPYMSPEQVTGLPVDARSDIWALGCVLYEMATARSPFAGDSLEAQTAAILNREPEPPSQVAAGLSARLDWIVGRCLRKDPERRWQSARDVALELEDESLASRDGRTVAPSSPASRWQGLGLWLAAASAGALLMWVALDLRSEDADTTPLSATYYPLALPDGVELTYRAGPTLAISPDGRKIAFTGDGEGSRGQIWILDLDSGLPPLRLDPRNSWLPEFSPDGSELAFHHAGRVVAQPLAGGDLRTLQEGEHFDSSRFDWAPDGSLLFFAADGVRRLLRGAGEAHPLAIEANQPSLLPGGHVLSTTPDLKLQIHELGADLDPVVLAEGFDGTYVPPRHIVFAQTGALYAMTFDLETLEAGPAVKVIDGLATNRTLGFAEYAVSDSGALVYLTAPSEAEKWLFEAQPDQAARRLHPDPEFFDVQAIAVSPDGEELVVSMNGSDDLWLFDLRRGQLLQPLHRTPGFDQFPEWSASGSHVTWGSVARDGSVTRVLAKARHGLEAPQVMLETGSAVHHLRSRDP